MVQAALIIILIAIGSEILTGLFRGGFSLLQFVNLIPDNLALDRMSARQYVDAIVGIVIIAVIILNILHYMGFIDLKSIFTKNK